MIQPRQYSYQNKLAELAKNFYENPHRILAEHKSYHTEPFRVGGVDLAKRVDHSALIVLRYEDGILKQEAHMLWPHVKYGKVAGDLIKVQGKYPMEKIGFDRNSIGDFASELFDQTTLPMEGIKTTMQSKIDMIHVIKTLFYNDMLHIDTKTELGKQITEQEQYISDAGNELYQHVKGRHDDLFWALGYACYVALEYLTNNVTPTVRHSGSSDRRREDPDKWIERVMNAS